MIIRSKRKLISASRWKGGLEIKRWHLSVLVFLVVATVLLLAGGVAAKTPCDAANALFNASLYDDAKTNYTELLKQNTTLYCAQDGILAVQRAKAIDAYDKGRAYENASQVQEASKAYVDALDKYPTFTDAQKALARLNGGILTSAYAVYTFLRPILEIIVVVAIVAFVLYTLIFQIWPWIKGFFKPSLDIQPFDKGATDLDIGNGLKAMVEESYKRLIHESRLHVNLVDGPPEKFMIPADVKVEPYFKFVSELINWLFPSYVITMSGYLQKPGDLGSGITIALVVNRTKEILGSCTIWQKEFDLETTPQTAEESKNPTSYYHLAEPVAIWVLFQLGKKKKKGFKVQGTDNWLSLAYYRAGLHWHLEDTDKARQLYLEALNQDINNYGALYNLGRLEFEDGHYEHACERLTLVQEATNSDKTDKLPEKSSRFSILIKSYILHKLLKADKVPKGFSSNPMWYLATYNLAITYRYMRAMYYCNLSTVEKDIIALVETITKAADAIRRNDETVLKCDLSIAEEKAKTLLESIYEIIAELETAVYISHIEARDETNQLIDIKKKAKKIVDTLREAIIARQKNDDKELKNKRSEAEKLAGEIKEAIKKLQEKESEPFDFVRSKAEQEATNLIETITKANDMLSTAEHARKLTDAIQEAIHAEQKKEDMKLERSLSKAKEQTKKLADMAIGRLNKNEKELKAFLETFNPLAAIMCANTMLYTSKIDTINEVDKINKKDGLMIKCIEPSRLNYRVRYNLACYYSILGDKIKDDQRTKAYKDALFHLEFTLEHGGGIVEWANKDIALKGVREDAETKEAFAKFIKKYAPQETPHSADLPLAGIAIIKEAYAKQLKEQGIVSQCDLILKADTPSSREELAKKLSISTKLLHRWALLADLMRIVGDTKHINLLEASDYGSIEALKNVSDPCGLANLLNQVNKAQSLVKQLPSMGTVQQWVQDAKNTKPKVL